MSIELRPVGTIHSPYRRPGDAPRQGRLLGRVSTIEIFKEYEDALPGVERFSHLIVLYWLDRADRDRLWATPPGETEPRGVFSTRSPHRPNPIGLAVTKLIARRDLLLDVLWLDALDGTPVVDIKPYSPSIDTVPGSGRRHAG